MNNRYFGNIHDFYKYALLRLMLGLTSVGGSGGALFNALGVGWMLTKDDQGKPGVGHDYLNDRGKWGVGKIDEQLFSQLGDWREQLRGEGVGLLRSHPDLFPGVKFFDAPIEEWEREEYFVEMRRQFRADKRDLIFLDPDYGLALGARDWGPGFLRASEVAGCYRAGFSVMFYQSQYGAQPNSARLVRHELRQAFGGRLPHTYAVEARGEESGLGRHSEAGKISPNFFLLPQPGMRDNTRAFLSRFRKHMWRREGKDAVFNIPGRIGAFVDYDQYSSAAKINKELRDFREERDDCFSYESAICWNGEPYGGKNKRGRNIYAEKPGGEVIRVVETGKGNQSVDAEISKRIRACVDHGEVDDVILFSSDKDFKLDAVIAIKHGIRFELRDKQCKPKKIDL